MKSLKLSLWHPSLTTGCGTILSLQWVGKTSPSLLCRRGWTQNPPPLEAWWRSSLEDESFSPDCSLIIFFLCKLFWLDHFAPHHFLVINLHLVFEKLLSMTCLRLLCLTRLDETLELLVCANILAGCNIFFKHPHAVEHDERKSLKWQFSALLPFYSFALQPY